MLAYFTVFPFVHHTAASRHYLKVVYQREPLEREDVPKDRPVRATKRRPVPSRKVPGFSDEPQPYSPILSIPSSPLVRSTSGSPFGPTDAPEFPSKQGRIMPTRAVKQAGKRQASIRWVARVESLLKGFNWIKHLILHSLPIHRVPSI